MGLKPPWRKAISAIPFTQIVEVVEKEANARQPWGALHQRPPCRPNPLQPARSGRPPPPQKHRKIRSSQKASDSL